MVGVEAARAAGMRCFGFTGGQHICDPQYQDKLTSVGAEMVFPNMRSLAKALQKMTIN
jgi:beta-phosphoglucomutase-like phosphatase (HAD superfamily)